MSYAWLFMALLASSAAAQARIPPPVDDHRRIDFSVDPVLMSIRPGAPMEDVAVRLSEAARASPERREADALVDEAAARRQEAASALRPQLTARISAQRSLSRQFDSDTTGVERLAPEERADVQLELRQLLLDFGAAADRVDAADARRRAAELDARIVMSDRALSAAFAWIALVAARLDLEISESFQSRTAALAKGASDRMAAGLGTAGDVARAEAFQAEALAALARSMEELEAASADYRTAFGAEPPAVLEWPSAPVFTGSELATLQRRAVDVDLVAAARLEVEASREEVDAARSTRLPRVEAGLSAVRFDVLDTRTDHDIRATLNLVQPIGTGGLLKSRVAQAQARSSAAAARLDRIEETAKRAIAVAAANLKGSQRALDAETAAYRAMRSARDIYSEQFRVARGSLLELLRAELDVALAARRVVSTAAFRDRASWRLAADTGYLTDIVGAGSPDDMGPGRP